MISTTNSIIIFTKPFNCTQAKTRLRASEKLTEDQANTIHNNLLTKTLNTCRDFKLKNPKVRVEVHWFSTPEDESLIEKYAKDFSFFLQIGDSFVDRFVNSIKKNADEGFNPIIIGSDCPELSVSHLERASRVVSQGKSVIGPLKNEGFYLLGMPVQAISLDISGIFPVESEQVSKLIELYRDYGSYLLESLRDLDEYEDYLLLRKFLI